MRTPVRVAPERKRRGLGKTNERGWVMKDMDFQYSNAFVFSAF
jgi:hypothetical protein